MKGLNLLILIVVFSGHLWSQELISASGSTIEDANTNLSYSIGETVVVTSASGSEMLTQGFHQSSVTLSYISESEVKISLYPNPNNGVFYITNEYFKPLRYAIVSMQGQLLQSGVLSVAKKEFDLTNFANGNYILEVFPLDDRNQKTILKICKTY